MPIFVYGLIDPDTNGIRYVGKSIRPVGRLANHMNEKAGCHRAHWLRGMKARGLVPTLVVLEVFADGEPWQDSERFWIAEGLRRGWRLTNNTSGGDGVSGLPPETREKMRRTWLGRKHRPETIEKLRGRRKWKHSDEHKAEMKRLMTGRTFTPEWIAKIRGALRKLTAEDCATIRRRIAAGETSASLAKEYGVHRTTIQKVKGGTYFVGGNA